SSLLFPSLGVVVRVGLVCVTLTLFLLFLFNFLNFLIFPFLSAGPTW
ncbi:unnamed protein product, partial [Prunus brigantina]